MEDHPFIKRAKQYSLGPDYGTDEGFEVIATSLALYGSADRVRALESVEQALVADDGCSLQQRAQLLSLHRRMSNAHDLLSRAKR